MAKANLLRRLLRIEPAISLAQWFYDRIFNNWSILVALLAGGGGMSYLASITAWFSAYGPLAIGATGLLSFLLIWVGLALAEYLRALANRRRIEGEAIQHWRANVDKFNPLSQHFEKLRMKLADLVSPIDFTILNKSIIECELFGPATIFFENDCHLDTLSFYNCDVVVLKPGPAKFPVFNVIAFRNCHIRGGKIANCTIIIPRQLLNTFKEMGASFLSLTGDKNIDKQFDE